MPLLELTQLEAKALWLMADVGELATQKHDTGLNDAALTALWKVYRAYRGMPPGRAA